MTPVQAAKVIGCTAGYVRHLIRKGQLQALRVWDQVSDQDKPSFTYYVYPESVQQFKFNKDRAGKGRGRPMKGS